MTNLLVGDVYHKIISDVVTASKADFEESGVAGATLEELRQEWEAKLSQRAVAQMPWDPRPQPVQPIPAPAPVPSASALPPSSYQSYDSTQANSNGASRVKMESSNEPFHTMSNGPYSQNGASQGGLARAQQLVQEYGTGANAMQQRGGLALPGQQAKPHGLQLPAGNPQQQFQAQQQQAMARQQQQLAQQQAQPGIKVENESPKMQQSSLQQRPNGQYGQTDGADEGLEEWRAMLAERRAISPEQRQKADRKMHEQVMQMSEDLQSGLMVTLSERPARKHKTRRTGSKNATTTAIASSSSAAPSIPQLDGEIDGEDEEKPDIKDEDDENAINSELDDSDDDAGGAMGDDDDDLGDSILCTYDKVQRVKNKWKCTLKDGVMSVNGKEWVFHKGMGEFEW